MKNIDPDKIAEILRDCAEEYILPRYKKLQDSEIGTKSGPADLVTIADKETEEALVRILSGLHPGSVVIGEEGVSEGTYSLDVLNESHGVVWVIDPVDGTYNFVHGRREFSLMMACVIDGATQYGWIYDVLGEETAIVEKGAGAFFGGRKMEVAESKAFGETIGHLAKKYFPPDMRQHVVDEAAHVKEAYSIFCASHEYLRLASGESDFAIYSKSKPWDHLAGVLMTQEAGGCAMKWDGSSYTPKDHIVDLIVASNQELWNTVQDRFIARAP